MSADEHLSEVQFMPVERLQELRSNDYRGTRVGSPQMRRRWARDATEDGPQRRHWEAGGHEQYLQGLTESVRSQGVQKPIEVGHDVNFKGERHDFLDDGHHRAMAAIDAGLKEVPYIDRGRINVYR